MLCPQSAPSNTPPALWMPAALGVSLSKPRPLLAAPLPSSFSPNQRAGRWRYHPMGVAETPASNRRRVAA